MLNSLCTPRSLFTFAVFFIFYMALFYANLYEVALIFITMFFLLFVIGFIYGNFRASDNSLEKFIYEFRDEKRHLKEMLDENPTPTNKELSLMRKRICRFIELRLAVEKIDTLIGPN